MRRRPMRARFGSAHLVAVLAGLVTLLALLTWTRSQEQITAIVVAAQDIRPGVLISDAALSVVEIPASASVASVMVSADERVSLVGQVSTRFIRTGEPVLDTDARAPVDQGGRRAMSVPIPVANAVGGTLVVGDAVDVLVVTDSGTRFVAEGLAVIGVPEDAAGGLASQVGSSSWVVLAVSDADALAIADGLENGTVHLLRATGTPELQVRELVPDAEPEDPTGEAGSSEEGGG